MDPLTVAAGVMAVGALVQLYNGEEQRGADKKRLDEIEQNFANVVPPEYNVKITDAPDLIMQKIKRPDLPSAQGLNLNALTPEMYKKIATFKPEIAPYIQEAAPDIIKKTGDMQKGRDAQLAALKRMQDIGGGEFDPQYQEMVQKSQRAAQGEAQSRGASIMQDFNRRGIGGSGMELAAKMGASSQAMDRNAQVGLSAASQAYQNRLNALMNGADLGGQIQNQEMDLQNRNANIINSFNQRVAAGRQGWENNRAGTLNDANLLNINANQAIGNANVDLKNKFAVDQQGRRDDMLKYQDDQAKWGYNADLQERAYGNALKTDRANWDRQGILDQNNLKQTAYNDYLKKLSGMSGASMAGLENSRMATQDRNQAIQGLSNAAMIYGTGQQDMQDRQNQRQSDADNYRNRAAAEANLQVYKQNGRFMDEDEMKKYKYGYSGSY